MASSGYTVEAIDKIYDEVAPKTDKSVLGDITALRLEWSAPLMPWKMGPVGRLGWKVPPPGNRSGQ